MLLLQGGGVGELPTYTKTVFKRRETDRRRERQTDRDNQLAHLFEWNVRIKDILVSHTWTKSRSIRREKIAMLVGLQSLHRLSLNVLAWKRNPCTLNTELHVSVCARWHYHTINEPTFWHADFFLLLLFFFFFWGGVCLCLCVCCLCVRVCVYVCVCVCVCEWVSVCVNGACICSCKPACMSV